MALDLETIQRAAEIARPIAIKLVPDCWNKFEELYSQRVNSINTPVIMLYGMYSHGKSTLINAILGQKIAQMAKPPTTDAIEDYEWKGGNCILRDTPGIQAKDRHTLLADESLRQCALVAFVVESGSIEESIVWETLARMLKHGQKICAIVNDFDDCRNHPEIVEPLKDKLRKHLQDAALRECFGGNIVADTPILIVNAKQALKGKIEHKERLVENSGLPQLEKTLVKLAASLDITDVLKLLKRSLSQCIADCKRLLARNNQKNILADAEMQLALIKGKRELAYDGIMQSLDDKLTTLASQIAYLFENANSENQIKSGLQEIVSNMISELAPVIGAETGEAAKQIENICLEYDKLREAMLIESNNSGTAFGLSFDIVNTFEWKSLLGKMNFENYAKDIAITVLQQCKKWLPELFKGIGPATMGRWAATAVSALGFVVSAAAVFFQIYNDYQAQQEAENRARRKAEAIRDSIKNIQGKLRQGILAIVNEIFADSFDKVIAELSTRVETLAKSEGINIQERDTLIKAEAILNA